MSAIHGLRFLKLRLGIFWDIDSNEFKETTNEEVHSMASIRRLLKFVGIFLFRRPVTHPPMQYKCCCARTYIRLPTKTGQLPVASS